MLNAFLIPKIELPEVLLENVDAVREYIVIDDNGVEKLMELKHLRLSMYSLQR